MLLEWNSFMCRRLTVSHFFLLTFFQLSWGIIDISCLLERFTWHKRNCRLFFFFLGATNASDPKEENFYSTSLILWPQQFPPTWLHISAKTSPSWPFTHVPARLRACLYGSWWACLIGPYLWKRRSRSCPRWALNKIPQSEGRVLFILKERIN